MHSVYLIRHGKSELGGADAERGLEPEGQVHAEQIAERLVAATPPVKALYTSPFRRAGLTMEPLAKRLGLSVTVADEFREKTMSDEPIADLKAARQRMWEDFDFRLPGGETNAEAQVRATSALRKIQKDHPDEAVAVVSHGTLMGLILNTYDPSFGYEEWLAITMPDIFRIDVPASGAAVVEHIGCEGIEAFRIKG
ncbi:MAG: histidine phosphatase family protein [Rhodospirillales bacterium]|jgi:2,3-bisphosphoglycerate-dependent phosphoglycerate mutase|nr:histidine phosphatase family protein [Rhodospirillales bacterium]MDP6884579.1 histidine phosphatase family protein [Rhodospirillales bacterium]